MRNPDRIYPLLRQIGNYWKKNPDLRLCQLLAVASTHTGWELEDLFAIEDDRIADGIRLLERMEQENKEENQD